MSLDQRGTIVLALMFLGLIQEKIEGERLDQVLTATHLAKTRNGRYRFHYQRS
jgi:hypothetical protein